MSVNSVQQISVENKRYKAPLNNNGNVSFGNNPIITLMDTIDRGGFMASFIIQDGRAAGRYRHYYI